MSAAKYTPNDGKLTRAREENIKLRRECWRRGLDPVKVLRAAREEKLKLQQVYE